MNWTQKMAINQSSSEDTQEEVETEVEEREITDSEDIELDALEAYEELKNGDSGEGGETPPTAEASVELPKEAALPEEGEAQEEEAVAIEPEEILDPPASWKAEGKEAFDKLPIEIKRDIHRRGKDLDNEIHLAKEQSAGYRQRYGALEEAISPYREYWHGRGMREDQAIMSLAAADKILEEDLVSGLDFIAKQRGTTIQEVANVLANGHESTLPTPGVAQGPQNTTYEALQNQLQYLTSKVQEQEQAKAAESQEQELAEIHSLRDERDLAGRHLRPEMHDEAFAKEQLIPMYQDIKARNPNQSPKEAMEQAYRAVTGKVVQSPVGLSSNNNQIRSRNQGAARSVRGSAVAAPKEVPLPVPDSVEDTMLQEARALGYDV